jgi:hypothetical protein
MLRPKFSIAIIVALTTALAMAALVYRHRVQVQWLECTLIALLSTGFRPPIQCRSTLFFSASVAVPEFPACSCLATEWQLESVGRGQSILDAILFRRFHASETIASTTRPSTSVSR